MAIKNRVPKSENDKKEMAFVEAAEQDNLKALSLDQLANRFEEIEQQGQLLQGRILLEARERFKSDNEFGAWVEQVGGAIYSTSRQHRTKLMNLAKFFELREINKISISAAYEISAPINSDIAVDVYDYAKGKNLPLTEIRKQIAMRKGEGLPFPVRIIPTDKVLITGKPIEEVETISTELVNEQTELNLVTRIMQIIENENPQIAIVALKNAIDKINAKRYGK